MNNNYIFNEIKKEKFKVPIIYFGMKDNHHKIARKLRENNNINTEKKFINIRDVDEEAYEQFIEYKPLIEKLISKKIKPIDLLESKDKIQQNASLMTALTSFKSKKTILI